MWNSSAHVWTADERSTPARRKYRQFTGSYKRTNGRAGGLASIEPPRRATPANNPHSQSVSEAVSHRSYAQLQRPDHTLFFQPQTAPFSRCSPRWARQVYASIRPSEPPAYTYSTYCFQQSSDGQTAELDARNSKVSQTCEQRINETRQLDTSSTSCMLPVRPPDVEDDDDVDYRVSRGGDEHSTRTVFASLTLLTFAPVGRSLFTRTRR